ncbi:MAG: amidohydrolase family protein [Bacilli bacterium]|nr:amidohydrolase family protein [Bacilli bacterium]
MKIIDSHSHIGKDNAWDIQGNLKEYVKKAKEIGITESLIMPVPMPKIGIGNSEVTPIMLATYGEENYIVTGVEDQYGLRPNLVSNNPYKYVNERLYRNIKNIADIKLHFIPLVNAIFDTPEYLERIIDKYHPIAFKIHGYSSIISPREIKDDFWNIIKKYDIPLIIHTDCDINENDSSLDWYYRNENAPLIWIRILDKNRIKGYLTHGVRLCDKSFEIVNNNPNFVVGLGPDALLSSCKDRMYSEEKYLETLFDKLEIDKICFDIDYPWNVSAYDSKTLDWNSIERIKKLKLSKEELEKVLSKNSQSFFKI